jgi:hypothetical protein
MIAAASSGIINSTIKETVLWIQVYGICPHFQPFIFIRYSSKNHITYYIKLKVTKSNFVVGDVYQYRGF